MHDSADSGNLHKPKHGSDVNIPTRLDRSLFGPIKYYWHEVLSEEQSFHIQPQKLH